MNLGSQHIGPVHYRVRKRGRVDCIIRRSSPFVARKGGVRDGCRGRRHAGAAKDLASIDVNHTAVIPKHPHAQVGDARRVRHVEGAAEIKSNIGRARNGVGLPDFGCFVIIAEAELRHSVGPCGVVKGSSPPRSPLVAAIVEVFPAGIAGDKQHRRRASLLDRGHRVGGSRARQFPACGVAQCDTPSTRPSERRRVRENILHRFAWEESKCPASRCAARCFNGVIHRNRVRGKRAQTHRHSIRQRSGRNRKPVRQTDAYRRSCWGVHEPGEPGSIRCWIPHRIVRMKTDRRGQRIVEDGHVVRAPIPRVIPRATKDVAIVIDEEGIAHRQVPGLEAQPCGSGIIVAIARAHGISQAQDALRVNQRTVRARAPAAFEPLAAVHHHRVISPCLAARAGPRIRLVQRRFYPAIRDNHGPRSTRTRINRIIFGETDQAVLQNMRAGRKIDRVVICV